MKIHERQFLHDIASPLAGVELLIETLFADIPEKDETQMRERLREALRGVDKMRHMLEERRSEVSDDAA